MKFLYTTIYGDTWDMIAKKVYNDEKYTQFLMKNNQNLLDIFIFSDGIKINTPPISKENIENLPPWRR